TEIDCSEGTEPLEWKLLTTEPVDSLEKAEKVVGWYAKRWGIEVFHRTLKSGCRIEDRQLGNDHRLEACLAIDMVVAWRLFSLMKLGREIPDAPCTVFFEEAEWKALCIYHSKNPEPPETAPTLREAIRMTAKMGGFLGRKGDGEPGTEVLWKGLQKLENIAEFWEILEKMRRA
ncbi:transposase IS4 family protein, partial [mine drainage metagenome]